MRCDGVEGGGARVSERAVSLEVAQLNMVTIRLTEDFR
jgi:hypothetical protein